MVSMPIENHGSSLRDQILQVLQNSRTTPKQDLAALLQCAAQIRNRLIVMETAKECGLRLFGFQSNDALELYYDLKRGRHDVGYISKGWHDPGFRVGDIVEVPIANISVLKANLLTLLKFCATNGIAATVEEKDDVVEIEMDAVIYSDGFNKKVFKQIIFHLNLCVEKANDLFGLS